MKRNLKHEAIIYARTSARQKAGLEKRAEKLGLSVSKVIRDILTKVGIKE